MNFSHQAAMSCLLGVVPQGQEGQLPPGQFPPQLFAEERTIRAAKENMMVFMISNVFSKEIYIKFCH